MRPQFAYAGDPILPPDFYQGAIVDDNGTPKIEWNEPGQPGILLTEQDLRDKEESSRLSLCRGDNPSGSEGWKRQRNINYSAEYGLQALQDYKRAQDIALDTPYRPVVEYKL